MIKKWFVDSKMQSYCRGNNWYVSRWGLKETFNPYKSTAKTHYIYSKMDAGIFW